MQIPWPWTFPTCFHRGQRASRCGVTATWNWSSTVLTRCIWIREINTSKPLISSDTQTSFAQQHFFFLSSYEFCKSHFMAFLRPYTSHVWILWGRIVPGPLTTQISEDIVKLQNRLRRKSLRQAQCSCLANWLMRGWFKFMDRSFRFPA